jgi:hypothetical protein
MAEAGRECICTLCVSFGQIKALQSQLLDAHFAGVINEYEQFEFLLHERSLEFLYAIDREIALMENGS